MSSKIQRGINSLIAPPRTGVAAPVSTPAANERDAYMPPERRSGINWPSSEQMMALIERGRAALSRGIIWDRGSIVNILL